MSREIISRHEAEVFLYVRDQKGAWLDNHTIAEGAGIYPQTVRKDTKLLTDLGLRASERKSLRERLGNLAAAA
jgi:hypothetical protein